ncbi:MAG: hypothetical protein N2439_12590 [Anaerolineae bacterium]|nr:hypothetical protein [Anaerolineae bacterium]
MSIGWRLFEGIGGAELAGLQATPLLNAPGLAFPVSLGTVGIWLAIGMMWAARADSFDAAFSIALGVSILASPITWCHYLILLMIPLTLAARRIADRGFARRWVYPFVIAVILLSVPASQWRHLMVWLARACQPMSAVHVIPFAVGLVDLIPAAATIALLMLVRSLSSYASFGHHVQATRQT